MYLTPTDKHWVIDIEANGLDPDRVWVLCAKNAVTGEERVCESYDEIQQFVKDTEGCYYVGHNILKYDIPVLNRLVRTRIAASRLVDTFLLSSIYSPNLANGHSLDAWGERLKVPKQKHEEWDRYSPEMLQRCKTDVEINWRMYRGLTARMTRLGFTEQGIDIEHKAWRIVDKQRKNGFYFDVEAAHKLFVELRAKEAELKERIYHRFPAELKLLRTYKKATKADGTPTADFKRHLDIYERLETLPDGSYQAYGYVSFDLGSPVQRVEKLCALGWIPEEFTKPSKTHPKGQPKATDKGELTPSLLRFAEESGIEEVKLIAQWIAVNGRANSINNWMNLYDDRTSCIHGNLWIASTLRYRHSDPNTANIPRIRKDKDKKPLFGEAGWWCYEARDLWQTRDRHNRKLVGVDAKGIQLRVLAHYLNDPAFTESVLHGDPHEFNRELGGFKDKDMAKTFIYAFLLGAGDGKVGEIIRAGAKEGRAIKKKFIEGFPGLGDLINKLKRDVERTGRITLCDGTPILVPSPHMVLAYLLQGDESRIMKQAAIYVDEEVRKEGLDVLKVGDIHDEWQNDVLQAHVRRFVEICEDAFRRAGEVFQYNLPIECEAKEGLTWAETH